MNDFYDAVDPRNIPQDLKIILAWTLGTIATIYIPFLNETFLRIVFALPFILFIPGYVLIAALFPKNSDIDGIERIALSFGLSIAIVPLIGLALNYTPWGIRLDPIVIALVAFTVIMTFIAHYRRAELPRNERFVVPVSRSISQIREELLPEDASGLDRALSIILIISIVAALATTIFVIVVPKEGEKFTEFYILGENGKAADYPTDFAAGSAQHLIIGISNHEYRNVTYTVEIYLNNQTFDSATNTSTLHSMERLDQFTVAIGHNTTWEEPYTFSVESTTYNRLQFLLFNETLPPETVRGEERINASYRDLHLWIDVSPQYTR
jgi:uncharacterized membrane protein